MFAAGQIDHRAEIAVVPEGCALWVMAAHGAMISSLPSACRQAWTCRGSGASSTCSRSRTVCARIRASARCCPSGKLPTTRVRCLNFKAGKSFQPLESEANFPLLQSSSRFSTSSTETAV